MSLARYGAESRRSPCLGWAVLAGAGLLAGLGLVLFLALPRLVVFSPGAGAQSVSSLAPVHLTFNYPMDRASVEAALAFSPERPGRFNWDGLTLTFTPAEPWPLNSPIQVQLSGARSQRGLPLLGTPNWTFTVGGQRLAYLAGEPANLWVASPAGDEAPRPITDEPLGLYDYAISPDGAQIVYAAWRADGGADLYAIHVDGSQRQTRLECPGEACVSPAFSPDGRRLAYARHTLVPGLRDEVNLGPSRIHVLNLASGADQIVGDSEGRFPRWGPDGRLAYLDATRGAIAVHDLASGAVTYVPNASGDVGTWSPDGTHLIFPELFFPVEPTPDPAEPEAAHAHAETFYNYLVRVTLATNEVENLSGLGAAVDDGSPVYAPSGGWLAFGRKLLADDQWTPGRQLWLMRPDGSEAHALTADPLYNHSAFIWSPDGTALAYMRLNTVDLHMPSEIWTLNLRASGEPDPAGPQKVATGYVPRWLP